MFKKGYDVAKEAAEKQEENRGKKLFNFFIPAATRERPDAEAEVQFLSEEPINFRAHSIKTIRKGREAWDTVVCYPEDNCPHCATSQAKPMGAYLLFDRRSYERKDQNGNVSKVEGQVRLYLAGIKIVTQLARISNRYGLTDYYYNIVRNGSGTSTTYSFERGDKVSKDAIAILQESLPQALKETFKPSVSGIDELLSDQLMMLTSSGSTPPEVQDDEDEDDDTSTHRNLISADDDDEDEEMDEELPKSKPSMKSVFKKGAKR